ncbi:hypothetical protein [Haladaptatus sp. AB643]|uniref:hypothetical protein n=1 Tax=Haladaptatus sp. AB643 TaxID=2934174 RepID=UPI00209C020B|nr:hypothetical protein [Haladaptatus sp. AB643]MCO8245302.1 hypothetical protein [Haladaptatus sp. AB643]
MDRPTILLERIDSDIAQVEDKYIIMNNEHERVLRPFKAQLQTLAESFAPSDRGAYCVEGNPLEGSREQNDPLVTHFEIIVENAKDNLLVADLGTTETKPILRGTFLTAYYDACALPEDCIRCERAVSTDHQCGHLKVGTPCPFDE